MKLIQNLNTDYDIRNASFEGVDHWVVPVIMMVEGVHNGSHGPIFYSAQELGAAEPSWNGIPITIHHPQDEHGNYISANTPAGLSVGRVFGAHMQGDQLRGEAWINPVNLMEQSPEALEYIKEHKALEVSVGVYSEDDETPGDYRGEQYVSTAHNLRPDHLALLPGSEGACSWDDGCGIRANNIRANKSKGGNNLKNKDEFLQHMQTEEFALSANRLIENEAGFREIMSSVQQKLDGMDINNRYHYLEELYDDTVVYRVNDQNSGETKFFQVGYSVNEDGSIEFGEDPQQVRKETSYVAVNEDSKEKQTVNNNQSNMQRTKKPCAKVDALISNEATHFTEDDRVWLETLEDAQLDKLEPIEVESPEAGEGSNQNSGQESGSAKKEEPTASSAQLAEEELDKKIKGIFNSKDPDSFMEMLPEGLKGQMKAGLKMYQEKRSQLISGIVANSNFEEADLKEWDDEQLEKLHSSVVKESVNYSAMSVGANGITSNEDGDEGLKSMISIHGAGEKKEES